MNARKPDSDLLAYDESLYSSLTSEELRALWAAMLAALGASRESGVGYDLAVILIETAGLLDARGITP